MTYIYFFLIAIAIFIVNNFLIKKNFLPSHSGEKHQKFAEKESIQLSGGIYLGLFFAAFFFTHYKLLSIFIFIILFLGLLTDKRVFKDPGIRFFFQLLPVLGIIYFYDLQILSTRVLLFDQFLGYKLLNYIFVCFCILIVINGTNFIDGLNGLVLGYYLIVLSFLLINNFLTLPFYSDDKIVLFFYLLFVLYLFNLFNKLYLGDSGAYILGLIFSFIVISFYKLNQSVSPYYIILLLWYPCFENLFSILRKFRFNNSPLYPDQNHFHQLLFFFIKKNIYRSNLLINNLSALIINIYNLIILMIGSMDIYNTKLQLLLILCNILIYVLMYIKLFNYRYKKTFKTMK
jgi:UDP-N-acetylmuramyl pentapeptide phosphotransferase/UDP-N-acetylglucosamine-1-phosphate transferase